MGLQDEVRSGIAGVLRPELDVRDGYVVPETDDLNLTNGAVKLQATYLYADLADSTGLAQGYKNWAAAKVIRCYLNAASRLIKARAGEIRSFDGDRVMGIFIGTDQETRAVKAGMNITWAIEKVIQPALDEKWKNFKWKMRHGVGIDTGEALLVRGGVRGSNDIVSIGHAPNVAAKLSERRGYSQVFITQAVHDELSDAARYSEREDMWTDLGWEKYGNNSYRVYGTTYMWTP